MHDKLQSANSLIVTLRTNFKIYEYLKILKYGKWIQIRIYLNSLMHQEKWIQIRNKCEF